MRPIIIFFLLAIFSCKNQPETEVAKWETQAQRIEIIR